MYRGTASIYCQIHLVADVGKKCEKISSLCDLYMAPIPQASGAQSEMLRGMDQAGGGCSGKGNMVRTASRPWRLGRRGKGRRMEMFNAIDRYSVSRGGQL
jgi:hypothetical protein